MKRFRLLRFYVLGVVALVALAVWGASLWRTAAEAGTPQKPEAAAVAPSTKNADLSRLSPPVSAALLTNAAAREADGAIVSMDDSLLDPKELVTAAATPLGCAK
jgi:hypothetical protein